jgi:hypothetical protein
VIKIRYTDLPAGVHVRTTNRGGHTVVFLLPGLTPAQRKAALRQARGVARVGQGPPLPRAALARALAADQLRATIRNGFGAMRMHPAIFFPPLILLLSAAVAYLLLVSATIHFTPGPHGAGPGGAAIGASAPPGGAVAPHPGPGHRPVHQPAGRSPAPSAPGPVPSSAHPTTTPVPPVTSPTSSPSPDPTPTPSSSASSPGAPSPSPSPSRRPSPSPTAPPAPGPGSGPGGGTVCIKIFLVGICLGI